jgi:RNA polymerase sigma-70 factor (ECF subfamily)
VLHPSPRPPGRTGAGGEFAAFYERELARVVAVVVSLTGDRATAEDIAHEAFASAFRRWATIRRYDRPGDWVKRVALNQAVSRFRRRRVEERVLGQLARRRDPQRREHDAEDPLWAAVRALPRRQAQVVALLYIDDLTIERAAATLGLSEGAVRSHLHRAKRTLAARVRPEGTDD